MQFGSVDHPQHIDFSLPADHLDTSAVLFKQTNKEDPKIFVGCSQWSQAKLKGFYPTGTKDALTYYATQFNSVELNATFYRIFSPETFTAWYQKTPEGFKFFPKLYQDISHWKRLNGVDKVVDDYLYSATNLKEKLGAIFLQMHTNFTPKDFDRVEAFVKSWPIEIPLAIEFRHTDWYNDVSIASRLYNLLETYNISNIIVDTPGRRDLMHMRLTNGTAFIRFVGANHDSDYLRLDGWVKRLKDWKLQGINEIDFFVHQNIEIESPLLAAYFIKKLNAELGMDLQIPNKNQNLELF
ncbi:DUF72 domain-containing protein [Gelidibacter pelagius]|uniref:DUF72 domain-containing protein n=1 Tax=Gelidibacter pelagius TaxID=2819985 RepID=A0ABS3SQZ1_9FLAO|nr:DUF72 domain-containing protein [Gelidibacter pelagius]MBO3098126.1 DUF72 domain-containing protein [Gelidibacter pelagius]